MIVIGLISGIASGKSIVCQVFKELGGVIIHSDEIGHETLRRPAIRDRLVAAFGTGILNGEGRIDRPALGGIVFENPAARKRLNAIVHPPILAEIGRRITEKRLSGFEGGIVVEAPVLIEAGGMYLVDAVLVITAPEARRRAWLTTRDGLSPEAAQKRIAAQLPDEDLLCRADYVIENDGDIEDLRRKARATWKEMTKAA